MEIVYVGPHADGVLVPLADGSDLFVAHGEKVEVPNEHAASLLEQSSNWKKVEEPKPVEVKPEPVAEAASAPTMSSEKKEGK